MTMIAVAVLAQFLADAAAAMTLDDVKNLGLTIAIGVIAKLAHSFLTERKFGAQQRTLLETVTQATDAGHARIEAALADHAGIAKALKDAGIDVGAAAKYLHTQITDEMRAVSTEAGVEAEVKKVIAVVREKVATQAAIRVPTQEDIK